MSNGDDYGPAGPPDLKWHRLWLTVLLTLCAMWVHAHVLVPPWLVWPFAVFGAVSAYLSKLDPAAVSGGLLGLFPKAIAHVLKLVLQTRSLVVLSALIVVGGLFTSSVRFTSKSAHAIVLRSGSDETTRAVGDDEPEARFVRLTHLGGREFTLSVDSYLDEPVTLYPAWPSKFDLSDLSPAPTVLVRFPLMTVPILDGAVAEVRLGGVLVETIDLDGTAGSLRLGFPRQFDFQVETWKKELDDGAEAGDHERLTSLWKSPRAVEHDTVLAPEVRVVVRVLRKRGSDDELAHADFEVGDKQFQDVLMSQR